MFLLPLVANVREESAAASIDLERKPAARDKESTRTDHQFWGKVGAIIPI
jgi:hypothetical protein